MAVLMAVSNPVYSRFRTGRCQWYPAPNTLYAMFLFKYRSTTKCAITTNSHKACTPAIHLLKFAALPLWYENAHFCADFKMVPYAG